MENSFNYIWTGATFFCPIIMWIGLLSINFSRKEEYQPSYYLMCIFFCYCTFYSYMLCFSWLCLVCFKNWLLLASTIMKDFIFLVAWWKTWNGKWQLLILVLLTDSHEMTENLQCLFRCPYFVNKEHFSLLWLYLCAFFLFQANIRA